MKDSKLDHQYLLSFLLKKQIEGIKMRVKGKAKGTSIVLK